MILNYALSISSITTHPKILSTSRGTTSVISNASTTQYTKLISHLGYGLSTQHISLYGPLCYSTICTRRVPQKIVTKTDIYWGLYRIRLFVFLTLLQVFIPRLEIIFCINHYFLVYIFKYCTSLRVNSGLEI